MLFRATSSPPGLTWASAGCFVVLKSPKWDTSDMSVNLAELQQTHTHWLSNFNEGQIWLVGKCRCGLHLAHWHMCKVTCFYQMHLLNLQTPFLLTYFRYGLWTITEPSTWKPVEIQNCWYFVTFMFVILLLSGLINSMRHTHPVNCCDFYCRM